MWRKCIVNPSGVSNRALAHFQHYVLVCSAFTIITMATLSALKVPAWPSKRAKD